MELLGAMYERRGMEFTEARKRMARMPDGATTFPNPVSTAPGFAIRTSMSWPRAPGVPGDARRAVAEPRAGTPRPVPYGSLPYGEGTSERR